MAGWWFGTFFRGVGIPPSRWVPSSRRIKPLEALEKLDVSPRISAAIFEVRLLEFETWREARGMGSMGSTGCLVGFV